MGFFRKVLIACLYQYSDNCIVHNLFKVDGGEVNTSRYRTYFKQNLFVFPEWAKRPKIEHWVCSPLCPQVACIAITSGTCSPFEACVEVLEVYAHNTCHSVCKYCVAHHNAHQRPWFDSAFLSCRHSSPPSANVCARHWTWIRKPWTFRMESTLTRSLSEWNRYASCRWVLWQKAHCLWLWNSSQFGEVAV